MTTTTNNSAVKMAELFALSGHGFVAVHFGLVNLEDLVKAYPGHIVRCKGPPSECIAVYPAEDRLLGCVAGWISEGD